MMSPSISTFSFATSVATSPVRTVVSPQSGSVRVLDTTYLGRLFNRSARAPVRGRQRDPKNS